MHHVVAIELVLIGCAGRSIREIRSTSTSTFEPALGGGDNRPWRVLWSLDPFDFGISVQSAGVYSKGRML